MPKLESITAATATEVKSDISPTLHPDAILPFGQTLAIDESPKSVAAFQSARSALKALYEGLADIEEASRQTRLKYGSGQIISGASIQAALPDDRVAQLAADMGDRFARVARTFDQHLGVVSDTIDSLSQSIERTLMPRSRDAMAATNASDIRRYIKDLPDNKRLDFIHKTIEDGDIEVAQAVLSTSGWVSGLNRDEAAIVRDLAAKTYAPKEHAQLEAAKKLANHLKASSQIFVERYKKLLPAVRESAHTAAIKKLKEA
jgi:hypothetical protein